MRIDLTLDRKLVLESSKIICPQHTSCEQIKVNFNMTSEDNGDLESFVASQYELVRRILESLTDLDLDACEKVNTLWANAVKVERNSDHRRRIEMFSWKGKAQTTRVINLPMCKLKKVFWGVVF